MKTAILALCLLGAAFAAPIENYVDPDCIEEDQTSKNQSPTSKPNSLSEFQI